MDYKYLKQESVTVGCGDWFVSVNRRKAKLRASHSPSKKERKALKKEYNLRHR